MYLMTYVGDLFHVANHLIVALSLLTQPRKEGFTAIMLGLLGGFKMMEIPFTLWERSKLAI